jgi:hypothetical protein
MSITEIVLAFYSEQDNYKRMLRISYRPELTRKEIIADAQETWGDIKVIGFEYH